MQSSSLSTYIGYITGPRAEQPVGVRVVEPPPGTRQNQRGSLYSVIEVVGDHPDRAAIVDRLLSESQRVYYSAKGSQSQVMLEAVQQTQQLLREINAHTPHYPLQLGITCAALLGGKLLVATSGPAFALMCVSGSVHMFPSEPTMTVGGYSNVPIDIHRQDVQSEDTLFIGGGSWLRRVPARTLASIVAFTTADNCTDAADELYDQAGKIQVPGLLIVLGGGASGEPPRSGGYGGYSGGGYPSTPGTSGGSMGSSTPRPPAPAPRKPRFSGLPTAVNTTPPARLPSTLPPSDVQGTPPNLGASTIPPSTLPYASASSSSSPGASSVPVRGSPQAWEPPPSELVPPMSAPSATPEPTGIPPSSAFDSTEETSTRQTRNTEISSSEISSSELDNTEQQAWTGANSATYDTESEFSTTDSDQSGNGQIAKGLGAGAAIVAAQKNEYPVSPLEEESFGGDLPVEPGEDYDPIFPPSSEQELPEQSARGPSWLEQWQSQANQRIEQARDFFGRMLPENRTGESGTEWQELPDTTGVSGQGKRPRYNEMEGTVVASAVIAQNTVSSSAAAGKSVAHDDDDTLPPMAPVMDKSIFAPPPPSRGARARLFLLLALVVVILVPVVVAAVNFGQGNSRKAKAEQFTARSEIVLLGAQSALDAGDKVTARQRLTEAQDHLAQAIELDGTNEQRSQLIATIESELQEVLQVIPLYGLTDPLITFPADARPEHVLVMNEDIFVIDGGRQALLQYRYDPQTNTVPDQLGQVVLSQGQNVDGVTVGTLADMAWLPLIPGFEDRPSLLITDRNNNVFRYDQRVDGASLLQLADHGTWGSIGQIQTFNGRIYLADEARGSVLRYDPGEFQLPGDPWFSPETQVNLAGLTSMEIDGDIWLLFSDGSILRYREREQLPFSPENSIGLAEEPVDMYVTREDSANIYLVDAGQDRILVYDKDGTYLGQLRAPEGDLLRGLSGIYIDEVGEVMYILTQTGLFAHPVLP